MQGTQIILIILVLFMLGGLGVLGWVFIGTSSNRQREIRGLMTSTRLSTDRNQLSEEEIESNIEAIKKRSGSSTAKKAAEDVNTKLFRAGLYSEVARRKFKQARIISIAVLPPCFYITFSLIAPGPTLALSGLALGTFIAAIAPLSWLDREIRRREEDIMYYLPLVIEQVSIGVSSALDIGPCISQIVQMADDRDSHNPVTEMFIHVEKLIRSGLNLEDSLQEIGDATGMTEVKHAFMFLAQCARHGGEVSKQLQELADAVMVQRQVQVEGRIESLPVKATGPLTMVFAGFFALLLAGLFVKLLGAFSGT